MLPDVFAITGPIGSGKTTLSRALARLTGWQVIEADYIIQDLTSEPNALGCKLLRARLPEVWDAVKSDDGAITWLMVRHLLRRNSAAAQAFYSVLHSLVEAKVAAALTESVSDTVIYDCPLSRFPRPFFVTGTILASCNDDVRRARIKELDPSLKGSDLRAFFRMEAPFIQREDLADATFQSDTFSLDELDENALRVKDICEVFRLMAQNRHELEGLVED